MNRLQQQIARSSQRLPLKYAAQHCWARFSFVLLPFLSKIYLLSSKTIIFLIRFQHRFVRHLLYVQVLPRHARCCPSVFHEEQGVFRIMRKRTSFILAIGVALPAMLGVVSCRARGKNSEANAAEIPSAVIAPVTRG